MYEAKLGLHSRPFGETEGDRNIFWSQAHKLAFDRLCFAAKSRALCTLFTGEEGAGRSMLARELLVSNIPNITIGLIDSPDHFSSDVSATILRAFEPEIKLADGPDVNRKLLSEFLNTQLQNGKGATIVVDDADLLSNEQLSSLCFLAAAHSDQRPLLKFVLIGLPEFSERLSTEWPELSGPSFMLEQMSRQDTAAYVTAALVYAGAKKVFFDREAIDEIYLQTKGLPQWVNTVCKGCMKEAATEGVDAIEPALIRKLANMYRDSGLIGSRTRPALPPRIRSSKPDSLKETASLLPAGKRPVAGNLADQGAKSALTAMVRFEFRRFGLTAKRAIAVLVLAATTGLLFLDDLESPFGVRVAALKSGVASTWRDVVSGQSTDNMSRRPVLAEDVASSALPEAQDRVARINQLVSTNDATAAAQFLAALNIAENTADAAVVSYARAALLGHERAAYYLGQIYETGEGVAVDLTLARAWYKMSGSAISGAVQRLMDLPQDQLQGEMNPPLQLFGHTTDGGGSVELIWTSAQGLDPSFYRVELSSGDGGVSLSVQPVSVSAIRLTRPENAHKWRVVAIYDQNGIEAASPWLQIYSN